MALPVLDGNQSATTLSSVITGGEHIVAHTVVSLGSNAIANITSAVSGSVVTIPSLARIANSAATEGIIGNTLNFIKIGGHQDGSNQTAHIVHVSAGGAMKVDASGSSVTFSTIAGTVTANLAGQQFDSDIPIFTAAYLSSPGSAPIPVSQDVGAGMPISGTVTVNTDGNNPPIVISRITDSNGDDIILDNGNVPISGTVTVGNSVTIGSLPAISGTVTVGAMPNGSLTTRFGTPTTANTAFATSAVTNASRKYLLIQNVTTGSNVITVGIGFTPTTTQGIQLTAGAGITFESSYIPTGAVYVLSSVTASNFTVLEA